MQQPRRINADDFRIRGEKMALSISLGLLILSLLVLVGISFGLILILIVIPVALVKVCPRGHPIQARQSGKRIHQTL